MQESSETVFLSDSFIQTAAIADLCAGVGTTLLLLVSVFNRCGIWLYGDSDNPAATRTGTDPKSTKDGTGRKKYGRISNLMFNTMIAMMLIFMADQYNWSLFVQNSLSGFSLSTAKCRIIYPAHMMSYVTGKAILYLLFSFRLEAVFGNHPSLAYSQTFLKSYQLLCTLTPMATGFVIIYYLGISTKYIKEHENSSGDIELCIPWNDKQFYKFLTLSIMIFDAVFSFLAFYLFIRKLYQISSLQRDHRTGSLLKPASYQHSSLDIAATSGQSSSSSSSASRSNSSSSSLSSVGARDYAYAALSPRAGGITPTAANTTNTSRAPGVPAGAGLDEVGRVPSMQSVRGLDRMDSRRSRSSFRNALTRQYRWHDHLRDKNVKLLYIMKKSTFLVFVSIVSTLVFNVGLGFVSEKIGLFIVCDGFVSSLAAMTMFKFADPTYNLVFRPCEVCLACVLTGLCYCCQVGLLGKRRESFINSDFVTIVTSDKQHHSSSNSSKSSKHGKQNEQRNRRNEAVTQQARPARTQYKSLVAVGHGNESNNNNNVTMVSKRVPIAPTAPIAPVVEEQEMPLQRKQGKDRIDSMSVQVSGNVMSHNLEAREVTVTLHSNMSINGPLGAPEPDIVERTIGHGVNSIPPPVQRHAAAEDEYNTLDTNNTGTTQATETTSRPTYPTNSTFSDTNDITLLDLGSVQTAPERQNNP